MKKYLKSKMSLYNCDKVWAVLYLLYLHFKFRHWYMYVEFSWKQLSKFWDHLEIF